MLGGRLPTYGDLAELKWTRMVIEEAMRLYPPAHTIARTALGEDRIGGVRGAGEARSSPSASI